MTCCSCLLQLQYFKFYCKFYCMFYFTCDRCLLLSGTFQKHPVCTKIRLFEMQNRFLFLEDAQHPQTRPQWGAGHPSPHPALLTPFSLDTPPTLIGASILAPTALELGPLPHLLILEPHCLVPDTSFQRKRSLIMAVACTVQ